MRSASDGPDGHPEVVVVHLLPVHPRQPTHSPQSANRTGDSPRGVPLVRRRHAPPSDTGTSVTRVASFPELVRLRTDLGPEDVAWLQLLQADWQIVADLSFADLVLWVRDREDDGFWACAQMRPTTGPTAYVDDIVGTHVPAGRRSLLDQAWAQGRIVREGDPEWRDEVPVRGEAIPVVRAGRVIGVVARHTNLLGVRTPSRLELSYLQTAADLTTMIAAGEFPAPGQRSDHADSPRVGDGFLRVDADARVVYASPNAQSVFRRLGFSGDLAGQLLPDLTRDLVPARRRPDEETLSAVLGGRAHRDVEIATDVAALIVRAIPLRRDGTHQGGLILVRDVTELRRRDRELVTKDATIREIHHRVKNNLQTVAALLRLQARRIDSDGGEGGPGGGGAPGRVDRDRARDAEPGGRGDGRLRRDRRPARGDGHRGQRAHRTGRRARTGEFGILPSESANALAMVLTELLQNAVEHGYADGDSPSATVRSRSASTGSSAACTSPSTTTDAGCPRASPSTGRRTSGSRSCARSWSPSWAASSSWRRDRAAAPRGRVVVGRHVAVDLRLSMPAAGSRLTRALLIPRPTASRRAHPRAGVAALESAALVLAETAPDPMILAGLEGPLQALLAHVAASADLLGLLDLEDGRTGVADREEQFRVLVEARGTVAPIHGVGRSFEVVVQARMLRPAGARVRRFVNVYTCGSPRVSISGPNIKGCGRFVESQPGADWTAGARFVSRLPRVTAPDNPPPLTVAASLVAVQGVVLVGLGITDLANIDPDRRAVAISGAVFFGGYGLALLACAIGLVRRVAWVRGPVLLTQLVQLGIAWNVRDFWPLAVSMAVASAVVLAGVLHPASVDALASE